MATYDVIVVGAGVEGLWTALHLAAKNNKTLLLEQFAWPHTRGSSHGQGRSIRKFYDKAYYSRMMPEAYQQWEKLEKDENTKFMIKMGLLLVDTAPSERLRQGSAIMSDMGFIHGRLSATELRRRFPMVRFLPNQEAVYDPEACCISANKAMRAILNQFLKHGGVMRDAEPVTRVTPGRPVFITTTKGQFRCRSVVLCAGPWTSKLLTPLGLQLPLKTLRVHLFYWKVSSDNYTPDQGLPAVTILNATEFIYGRPAVEYPRHIKLSYHGGPEVDPDSRDAVVVDNVPIVQRISALIRTHFPGVESKPSIIEPCIYTMTPDEDFILDTHPQWDNIVIGAGFSGHGFKLAPVVGRVLSELATRRRPSYDLTPFRIDRFAKNTAPFSKL